MASMQTDRNLHKEFEPRDNSLKGLRNTVLVRLLIVALIPLAVLSVYFRYQFKKTLQTNSRVMLQTIAKGHRDSIDRFIQSKVSVLQSLEGDSVFPLPWSKDQINSILKVLQGQDKSILDIGVFDAEGNHVRYAGPFDFLEGKNYREESWFSALAASDSDVLISDVYLGYRGKPHFIVAVRTYSGEQPWYLRMTIHPTRFAEMVSDVQVLEGAHAYIANADGLLQCAPQEVGQVLTTAPITPQLDTDQDVQEVTQGGTGYLAVFFKLKSTQWTLVVRQELKAAYAPIQQAHLAMVAIVLLGVVIIVSVSLFATESLVRRYSRAERDRAKLLDQLVQAGKMSTLGEMAAGVAHEINNPLAVILSEVGVMEDILDPQFEGEFDRTEFLEKLDSLKDETFRCKDITHKLLGFARFHKTELRTCQVNDLCKQTVGLIRRELQLENIEIALSLQQDLPSITTDEEKVKQVLLNLLRNAADAIGKDGKISVETGDGGNSLVILVSDTGVGIGEKELEKIFQPFFTTKEVGKGTGLGLSISHGIITSLGGTIEVTSKVGKGTIFTVCLPKKGAV